MTLWSNIRFNVLVVFLILSFAICSANDYIVYDSFQRPDSIIVGQTEVGGYFWYEVEHESDLRIQIINKKLDMHDTRGGGTSELRTACNIAGLKLKDVDISTEFSAYDNRASGIGISYRMPEVDGVIQSDGYHVTVNKETEKVYLTYGPSIQAVNFGRDINLIASADIDWTDTITLRVVAVGDSHQVYYNGKLVISVYDQRSTSPGYLGVFNSYSRARFNYFAVKEPK